MTQPKTLQVEEAAGKRADFVVFYTRAGRPYLDAIWAADAEAAEADFKAAAAEVGWKDVVVDRVEKRDPQPLTVSDLEAALGDERHLGFGYAISSDLSPSRRERLNRSVVAVANDLGLDPETLFHWANSKWGRWLVDGVYGRDESPSRENVRKYLNEKAVEEALDGVEVQ